MGKLSRISAIAASAVITAASCPMVPVSAEEVSQTRSVVIDGSRANTSENMLYRGNGMVS